MFQSLEEITNAPLAQQKMQKLAPLESFSLLSGKFQITHYRTLRPAAGQTIDYEVVDICVGGLDRTDANLKDLAKVMSEYPDNLIPSENRGTDPICSSIPTASISTDASKPKDSTDDPNSGSRITAFAGLLSILFL
jgi:hypothetical protein